MPEPRVRRSVDLPAALYERLVAAARAMQVPVNTAIVQAVEQWLARHEEQAKGEADRGGSPQA